MIDNWNKGDDRCLIAETKTKRDIAAERERERERIAG
jgi:hypothetical protein